MNRPIFRQLKLDFILAGLLLVLGVMNLPLLTGRTQIFWDTFNIPYESFTIFYSEVYYHHQIPLWMPYASYGMPDTLTVAALSIVNFLFIGLGKLFSIQNTFLLFKTSLVAEQVLSLTGMYVLAHQLYKNKWVIVIVCLTLMSTFIVYRQLHFNFRMVYLLPWMMLWLVLFVRRQRAEYLWLAGFTAIFSMPGTAFYPMLIVFYGLLVFTIGLLFYDPRALRAIVRPSWSNLLTLFGLLLVGGLFLYYFGTYDDGVSISRVGRNADLTIPLGRFLNNWKIWSPLDLSIAFLTGVVTPEISNAFEYTLYIGLLPIVGVVSALLFRRDPVCVSILITAAFLYVFSLRGFATAVMYFFPMINFTRYASVLGTVPLRTFLILAAGFGLDGSFTRGMIRKIATVLLAFVIGVEVVTALIRTSNPASMDASLRVLVLGDDYFLDFQTLAVRILIFIVLIALIGGLYFLMRRRPDRAALLSMAARLGLIFVVAIDLFLYRRVFETKIRLAQPTPQPLTSELVSVSPLTYQPKRFFEPRDQRARDRLNFAIPLQASTAYIAESFVQFDGCVPYFLNKNGLTEHEMVAFSVRRLIDAGLVITQPVGANVTLRQIYGCESPKLKVVSNVWAAHTDAEVASLLQERDDVSNLLVLSKQHSQIESDLDNAPIDAEPRVLDFDSDQLTVEVDLGAEAGGWLVYSDAYHPTWQATVNGERVEIEPAYLAFKAVRLSSGKNLIEFRYGTRFQQLAYGTLYVVYGIAGLLGLLCVAALLVYRPLQRALIRHCHIERRIL